MSRILRIFIIVPILNSTFVEAAVISGPSTDGLYVYLLTYVLYVTRTSTRSVRARVHIPLRDLLLPGGSENTANTFKSSLCVCHTSQQMHMDDSDIQDVCFQRTSTSDKKAKRKWRNRSRQRIRSRNGFPGTGIYRRPLLPLWLLHYYTVGWRPKGGQNVRHVIGVKSQIFRIEVTCENDDWLDERGSDVVTNGVPFV